MKSLLLHHRVIKFFLLSLLEFIWWKFYALIVVFISTAKYGEERKNQIAHSFQRFQFTTLLICKFLNELQASMKGIFGSSESLELPMTA